MDALGYRSEPSREQKQSSGEDESSPPGSHWHKVHYGYSKTTCEGKDQTQQRACDRRESLHES